MTVLRQRHGDPAGPAAELEDRPAGPARESTEPFDIVGALERPVVEVVQRGEPRGLVGVALDALPVTRRGRREPPVRV
jgi:hypothetical protein